MDEKKARAVPLFMVIFFLVFMPSCVNRPDIEELASQAAERPPVESISNTVSLTPLVVLSTTPISGESTGTGKQDILTPTPGIKSRYTGTWGSGSKSDLDELILKAKEDLARRLDITTDHITLLSVIGQEFTRGEFDCRTEKGRTARDVPPEIVEGYNILLSTDAGRRYEYHGRDQEVFFCRVMDNVKP